MTTYTFDGLMDTQWEDIYGKKFIRIDTGELIGSVYAKYPDDCGKLSAIVGNGLIEFIIRRDNTNGKDKITKIYGINALRDIVAFRTIGDTSQ